MLGAPLGIALWSILGFFNGIGRPVITLRVTASVAVANALLNQLFIFDLGWASPVRHGRPARRSCWVCARVLRFLGPPYARATVRI